MFKVAPRPTVTMYESKMREALACPTQGQPETLCAHGGVAWAAPGSPRVGCQNQYLQQGKLHVRELEHQYG